MLFCYKFTLQQPVLMAFGRERSPATFFRPASMRGIDGGTWRVCHTY